MSRETAASIEITYRVNRVSYDGRETEQSYSFQRDGEPRKVCKEAAAFIDYLLGDKED